MVRYEYKVLDGKSQDDIERKLNELAKEGCRLASFNTIYLSVAQVSPIQL